jgi:uncharacterized membrane protein YkgB
LQREDHLFVNYWVVVPEAFAYGEGIGVEIPYGSGSGLFDTKDVGLFVAHVVLVVASDYHNLLLGDLDGSSCG